MAKDFRINKVNYDKPFLPLLLNDQGDVMGYQAQNGQVTVQPCGTYDVALTAFAGGGQASALKLNYRNARIATVATTGDSVALPPAVTPGLSLLLINAGANSMQVFGDNAAADTINGVATATGVAQMSNA